MTLAEPQARPGPAATMSRRRPWGRKEAVVSVVVPRMVVHHLDPHTGIPFMPHMAAHLAGALRADGYRVQALDCFGLDHTDRTAFRNWMLVGAGEDWVADHLHPDSAVCFVYCRTMAEFIAVERMTRAIKARRPDIKVCLFENVQAVTSFSMLAVAEDLLDFGADLLLLGEPERRAADAADRILAGEPPEDIPGVAWRGADGHVRTTPQPAWEENLEDLPLPAWELFPLEGYWRSRLAHGPITRDRILPILTSRGCPYGCTFCVIPAINRNWRGRDARSVADEMEHFYRTLGVEEFHVSDLNPTVNDVRTRALCRELIARNLPITWKLAQGTKIETIKDEETLELMARAGCAFVAFSPETGSPRLLRAVNKPFDHAHGLRMARKMSELGIRVQACFVAGLPEETEDDRHLTLEYMRQLIAAGVDEMAVYIFTPIPGAALFGSLAGYRHYSECTHSPTWRSDYRELAAFRRKAYLMLLAGTLRRPARAWRELRSLVTRRFETKMTMAVYKQFRFYAMMYLPRLWRAPDAAARLRPLG